MTKADMLHLCELIKRMQRLAPDHELFGVFSAGPPTELVAVDGLLCEARALLDNRLLPCLKEFCDNAYKYIIHLETAFDNIEYWIDLLRMHKSTLKLSAIDRKDQDEHLQIYRNTHRLLQRRTRYLIRCLEIAAPAFMKQQYGRCELQEPTKPKKRGRRRNQERDEAIEMANVLKQQPEFLNQRGQPDRDKITKHINKQLNTTYSAPDLFRELSPSRLARRKA